MNATGRSESAASKYTSEPVRPGAAAATSVGAKKIPTPIVPLMPSVSSAKKPSGFFSSRVFHDRVTGLESVQVVRRVEHCSRMQSLDLNEVMVFARVVEAQGFTAAAKRLGLPKSTVSRKVAQLERRLGVALLVRTTRSLHLTDAGRAYYARTARVLTELDEAERSVKDLRANPRGTLRITAPADFALLHGWEVISEFTQKYPEVSVMLSLTSRYVDMVGEGFDLALRAGPLADSSLVARKLADGSLGLFATPQYLKKHGTPRSVAELSEHTCVIFGREPRTVWKLSGPGKGQTTSVTVQGSVCADDYGFVLRAVLAGSGIGLVPQFLTADDVRKKRLVRVFEDVGVDSGGLHLVYPASRHLSAAARAFIDFTLKRLSFLLAK